MYLRIKTYTIPLHPISWQRAKLNKRASCLYDGQKNDKLMCGLHLRKCHGDEETFSRAMSISCLFFMKKPTSARKPWHQHWHTTYPDIDNLEKFLYDTLVDAEIIADDRLICEQHSKKIYDDNPRTEIIIREVDPFGMEI